MYACPQRSEIFLSRFVSYLLRYLPLNLKLIDSTKLIAQQAPGIFRSPFLQCWDYMEAKAEAEVMEEAMLTGLLNLLSYRT